MCMCEGMAHRVAGYTEGAQVFQLAQTTALVDRYNVVCVPGVPFQTLAHQLIPCLLVAVRYEVGCQLC